MSSFFVFVVANPLLHTSKKGRKLNLNVQQRHNIFSDRDLEEPGFYGDIPEEPNNCLICSKAHMVEMDPKTNFL